MGGDWYLVAIAGNRSHETVASCGALLRLLIDRRGRAVPHLTHSGNLRVRGIPAATSGAIIGRVRPFA